MRSTPLHCTALHCTELNCNAMHCTAIHNTTLHCTALHCTTLHCTALHYTTLNNAMIKLAGSGPALWRAGVARDQLSSDLLLITCKTQNLVLVAAVMRLALNHLLNFKHCNVLSFAAALCSGLRRHRIQT